MAQSKGEKTRQAILEAAIARFGREGYRATSVADIARDASVGGTVAYAYFPSKEALFLAAVDEDAAGVIREGVDTILANPGVPDWRQMLIFTLVAAVERHPLARRLLAHCDAVLRIGGPSAGADAMVATAEAAGKIVATSMDELPLA
jgi:AcrR family transcriptional regulator